MAALNAEDMKPGGLTAVISVFSCLAPVPPARFAGPNER